MLYVTQSQDQMVIDALSSVVNLWTEFITFATSSTAY